MAAQPAPAAGFRVWPTGSAPNGMVPPLPDWVILRPRLFERLRKGVRGPLTVVTGPPGSGKSLAVNSWAATVAQPSGPVVWMSGDRTPKTMEGLCAGLAEGLSRAGAGARLRPLRTGTGAQG
ncbi:hypothetical protein, partial [Nonomuraea lactucae]|uniref:hypothetical protein n=1 Tax=Nonomuraea lactucae TaxID=2249762 RepID=UPI001963D334